MISWMNREVDAETQLESGAGAGPKHFSGPTCLRWPVIKDRKAWTLLLSIFLWAGLATAADPQLEGEGILGERNLPEQSLEIGGAVYFFGESSVIVGRSGEILSLEDLDVHDEGARPGLLPVLSGRFSATEVGSRYVIQRFELIESPR